LSKIFDTAYTAGARIHTNSWGRSDEGAYTETSRAVDEFMWRHRDMLILFSAGNEGVDLDGDGMIDPDSIGSPATAKNCLTVGACENNRPSGTVPQIAYDWNWTRWSSLSGLIWPYLDKAGHLSDNPEGMAAFSSRAVVEPERPYLALSGQGRAPVRQS
jgi:serine protease AprX